ncbi:MAG: guanylate kinase [Candidatus Omnitrophica bacterium]|nr:guanylate kinase [Candidatus Omnitrophota bacterium]
MNKKGRIIILSGPSGAGKTTLHDLLLKSPEFRGRIVRSVSATTRKPRGTEKQGREYFFFSKKMFEHKIRTHQFLEWARVFDNYYGTPIKNVREILSRGRHVLLCIDVQGARLVRKKVPEAFLVFVKTPSLDELRRRLEKRGTDSKESISLRLKTARLELKDVSRYDCVIVNDELNRAFGELKQVLAKI